MVETTFNLFDAIVILVVFLSSLLSFFRGFVKEILSLGAWVGASLITLYHAPSLAEMIEPQIKHQMGAYIVASLGTFFVSLIVISIFNSILMRLFKKSKDIGLLDNGLGLVFGVARAVLLLSLGYYILSFAMAEDNYPPWLAESQTRPYVAEGAKLLAKIAPDYLETLSEANEDSGSPMIDSDRLNDLIDQTREGTADAAEQSYEWIDSQDLDRMIETIEPQPGEKPSEIIERLNEDEIRREEIRRIIERNRPAPADALGE